MQFLYQNPVPNGMQILKHLGVYVKSKQHECMVHQSCRADDVVMLILDVDTNLYLKSMVESQ